MEEQQNNHYKVEKLLKNFIPEPIQQITSSTGSKPGDNIIGKMLALHVVTESGKKYDLILKSFVSLTDDKPNPMELLFSKVMSAFRVFGNELAYYDSVQPEMEKLVKYSLPTPQTYFSHNDDAGGGLKSCLILEDLRPQGYKMGDKISGLSSLEIFMVLEKIAKFHAASYVYLEKADILKKAKDADHEDVLTVHVFEKSKGIADGVHTFFMNTIYFDMIDVLKEKKGIEEELLEKILKVNKDPLETILEASKLSAEKYFHVINHGDMWVNNILFKYDAQAKPIDVRFIDFQQCRYSSIFDELHYFFYTSTNVEFRKENLMKCLDFYYDTFTKMLNTLNYPIPSGFTRENLKKGYFEFLNAGFCYALMAVPFQVGKPQPTEKPPANKIEEEETTQHIQPNAVGKTNKTEELKEIIFSVFENALVGLKEGALNSPIAINRLRELCMEMNSLGVFDKVNNTQAAYVK